MFRLPKETELTTALLDKFIGLHRKQINDRYQDLLDAYMSNHKILHQEAKPAHKPDNRIVVNFPKYIVDTMNGYSMGNPIKIVGDNDKAVEFAEYINSYNDQDNNNAELSKISSIFGRGYEMYYVDDEAELCITYLNPIEAFMIYDESIVERPLYFVRRYEDYEGYEYGSVSNGTHIRNFALTGGTRWTDEWTPHLFPGVPATELVENDERQGLFEPSLSMINAYNKAISEKANDVDYFADAYLKILGPKLNGDDINYIRSNRVLTFDGENAEKIIAEFMSKPSNDESQENLLNRLETLIFQISMVANISDENFGTSSGIALKYKLQAMSNLQKVKERKFTSCMNRRYKLLFGHPLAKSKVAADDWVSLKYKFTPNLPANLLEEAQIASQLEGIVSHETQLTVISAVESVQGELDRIEEENTTPMSAMDKALFNLGADDE